MRWGWLLALVGCGSDAAEIRVSPPPTPAGTAMKLWIDGTSYPMWSDSQYVQAPNGASFTDVAVSIEGSPCSNPFPVRAQTTEDEYLGPSVVFEWAGLKPTTVQIWADATGPVTLGDATANGIDYIVGFLDCEGGRTVRVNGQIVGTLPPGTLDPSPPESIPYFATDKKACYQFKEFSSGEVRGQALRFEGPGVFALPAKAEWFLQPNPDAGHDYTGMRMEYADGSSFSVKNSTNELLEVPCP